MTSTLINIAKSPITHRIAVGAFATGVGLVIGKRVQEDKFSLPKEKNDALTLLAGTIISTALASALGLSLTATAGLGTVLGVLGGALVSKQSNTNTNNNDTDTNNNDTNNNKKDTNNNNNDTNNNNNDTNNNDNNINDNNNNDTNNNKKDTNNNNNDTNNNNTNNNNNNTDTDTNNKNTDTNTNTNNNNTNNNDTDTNTSNYDTDTDTDDGISVSSFTTNTPAPVQPPATVQTTAPVQPPATVQTTAPVQPPAPVQTTAPVQKAGRFVKIANFFRRQNTTNTPAPVQYQTSLEEMIDFVTAGLNQDVTNAITLAIEKAISELTNEQLNAVKALNAVKGNQQFEDAVKYFQKRLTPRSSGKPHSPADKTNENKIKECLETFDEDSNERKVAAVILNTMNDELKKV